MIQHPQNNYFDVPSGVINTDTFSRMYPVVNHFIMDNCELQQSRDGEVRELLDIKTHLTNPYRRCVGGYHRNINIFFLFAEAMWIATGRKDVEFLTIFNKQMKEYSDDGKVFHAPYGYRLRHWGIASEEEFLNSAVENKGYDQVVNAIRILSENPNSRQVVMEIWNPTLDLGHVTKDLPCNDIVMLKIRDGKLITTIGNRSNDLHWGLPTNVFQFSFLTELMAAALGITLGTQTHNSQSLHIYSWNDVAEKMNAELKAEASGKDKLYDIIGANERLMDFKFKTEQPVNRFKEIDYHLNLIIDNLIRIANGEEAIEDEIAQIKEFSTFFTDIYTLLTIYLRYKKNLGTASDDMTKDIVRCSCISEIELIEMERLFDKHPWDVSVLAKNFFAARLSQGVESSKKLGIIGTL